jgi:cell division protease FtsH
VHKVTIIPRGRALGVTWLLPERDRFNTTKEYMEAQISFAMGGRLAEEAFFGQLSTGASNDIQQATSMARSMVTEYGMSEKAGPLNYAAGQHEIFLGRDFTQQREMSEETAKLIDAEIRDIVMRNYQRAKEIITEKKDCLVAIAEALLERETLDTDDIKRIMDGKALPPMPPRPGPSAGLAFDYLSV